MGKFFLNNGILVQGSPSGGGHVPPGGDASRMTTTDDDEVFMQKVYIGGMRSGKNVDNIIRYHRLLEEEGWDIAEARCDKLFESPLRITAWQQLILRL